MSKPAEPERWIDCGHNECRSRTNVAYGWPCIFAGKYADTIGPLPHQKPVEAASEVSCHDHGNCELCDQQERATAALRERLAKAREENERLLKDNEAHWQRALAAEADLMEWRGRASAAGEALIAAEAALAAAHEGDVQRVRDITKYATVRDAALSRIAELEKLLKGLYAWDHMDTAGDGKFWRGEIERALSALKQRGVKP